MIPDETAARKIVAAWENDPDWRPAVRNENLVTAIAAAIAAERETCLTLVEEADCGGPECGYCGCRDEAAQAIHARGAA